jgi:metallo-beta-lactamase family protein
LEVEGTRILLDCGLYQGGSERHERNRQPFAFDPRQIDYCILSHAHIDHCGRLPLLKRAGFAGPVITTAATVELCQILLPDSAHIQEEDAHWKTKRLRKEGKDASWVQPLYTVAEAEDTLTVFESVPYDQRVPLRNGLSVTFRDAGHIIGSSIVDLQLPSPRGLRRLVFTGDLGGTNARLLHDPTTVTRPDVLLMETTYGNRVRDTAEDVTQGLEDLITATHARGGNVVIPSFAVGRTQELLARLNDLVEHNRIPPLPVYVDSPMAVAATRVFRGHDEGFSPAMHALIEAGDDPLKFPGLQFTRSVDESKQINASTQPAVIISASGMCDAGRIKHHLVHNLGRRESTILFAGYQASGTLGDRLQRGENRVRIFGEMHSVNARVRTLHGLSAHADREGLLNWFSALGGCPEHTFLVHGEEQASLDFQKTLEKRCAGRSEVPTLGESADLRW